MTVPAIFYSLIEKLFSLALYALLLLFSVYNQAGTVAVVQSYSADYRWDAQYLKAIDDALGKHHEIQRYELDTKKLPRSQWENRAQEVLNQIRVLNPGVVMMGDDNALTLLGEAVVKLDIPVVFLGSMAVQSSTPSFTTSWSPVFWSGLFSKRVFATCARC